MRNANCRQGGGMMRRSLTVVTVMSLVLCLTTAGLWVRSYWIANGLTWSREATAPGDLSRSWNDYELAMARGTIQFSRFYGLGPPSPSCRIIYASPPDLLYQWTARGVLGFANGGGVCGQLKYWNVPLWFPAVVFATLPVVWVIPRRRKYAAGLCAACGYDLRASAGRCPECGAVHL